MLATPNAVPDIPSHVNLDNLGRGMRAVPRLSRASEMPAVFHKKREARGSRLFRAQPRRPKIISIGDARVSDGGRMADSAQARLRERRAPFRKTDRGSDNDNTAGSWRERRRPDRRAKWPSSSALPLVFATGLAAALVAGWLNRDEEYLVPGSGAGYWLGVAGAAMMLLLLLYPLRKRVRLRGWIGSVAFWFRLHMVLGVVGPALVLFHANFGFGSLNSNVALIAMLTVAASGIVGRYLYGKIHLGLYGRKAAVQELLAEAQALENLLGDELPGNAGIVAQIHAFAQRAAGMRKGILAGFWALPALAIRAGFTRRRLQREARRLIRTEGKRRGWSRRLRAQHRAAIGDLVRLHLAAVRKAAAFEFYDRLFGLWHVLHLPLFIILIFAASIHVVAAHLY
jgi:hypothetical protein